MVSFSQDNAGFQKMKSDNVYRESEYNLKTKLLKLKSG